MREGEVILKSVDTRKRKVAEKGGLQGGRLISHALRHLLTQTLAYSDIVCWAVSNWMTGVGLMAGCVVVIAASLHTLFIYR